jgi:cytochrome b
MKFHLEHGSYQREKAPPTVWPAMSTLTKESSMNTTSESHTEAPDAPDFRAARRDILVWDAPVRIFHWLMVLCFAGAYLTAESESMRLVHVTLGYTMVGLVGFRLVWGLVGSRHARFSNFVQGPTAVIRYLRSLVSGRPEHYLGHNPAGALAILALLSTTLLLVATGWANYNDIGGHWTEELHEGVANIMLAIVVVHVAAVLLSSWLHRENLIGSMLHGYKTGTPGEDNQKPWRAIAAVLLAAVIGFWWWQWQTVPGSQVGDRPAAVTNHDADGD